MLDLEFIKTPAIFAVFITGSLTALRLIMDWFNISAKSKFETKTIFEKNLKERLENIYTPLIMQINMSPKGSLSIDGEIKIIINKYGYLLSNKLLCSLKEIILYEEQGENAKCSLEYQNLRTKIDKIINEEFTDLQDLYNESFDTYKLNSMGAGWKRTFFAFKKGVTLFVGVFWFTLISFLLWQGIEPMEISQNPIANRVIPFLLWVIVLTNFLVFMFFENKVLSFITLNIKKRKKLFHSGEYVPQTGLYRCRVCNETKTFYKDETFQPCQSKLSLKKVFYINHWSLDIPRKDVVGKELNSSI